MRINIVRISFSCYLIALVYLSIMPSQGEKGLSEYYLSDTGLYLHFIAYFVCSVLAYFALGRKITLTIIFVLLFSCLLEIIQYFIPYRTFNPLDIAANVSGVGLLMASYLLGFIFFKKNCLYNYI